MIQILYVLPQEMGQARTRKKGRILRNIEEVRKELSKFHKWKKKNTIAPRLPIYIPHAR